MSQPCFNYIVTIHNKKDLIELSPDAGTYVLSNITAMFTRSWMVVQIGQKSLLTT